MSGQGSPDLGDVDPAWSGMRVAVVSASWHTRVVDGLRAGAARVADRAGVVSTEFVAPVPSSFPSSRITLRPARASTPSWRWEW